MAPAGDPARNPGLCPDWESNQRPFSSQVSTQSTEPHQPGRKNTYLKTLFTSDLSNRCTLSNTRKIEKKEQEAVFINPPLKNNNCDHLNTIFEDERRIGSVFSPQRGE